MSGLLLLAVVGLWLWALTWLLNKIGKRLPNRPWKPLAKLLIFALLVPLPLVDEILGGWQFRRLCGRHDKIQVDREKIKGATIFSVQSQSVELPNMWIPIRHQVWSYVYKDTGGVALRYDSFHAQGGWFIRALRISEGNVPLMFRDSCFPTENPVALTKSLSVTALDHPAKIYGGN